MFVTREIEGIKRPVVFQRALKASYNNFTTLFFPSTAFSEFKWFFAVSL